MKKNCTKCKEYKLLSAFYKRKDGTFFSQCRDCDSKIKKKRYWNNPEKFRKLTGIDRVKNPWRYAFRNGVRNKIIGFTDKELWELRNKHIGVCDICQQREKNKNLSMDHNHETKKFRGFLCGSCNRGIGMFKDDVKLLKKAIKYLQRI